MRIFKWGMVVLVLLAPRLGAARYCELVGWSKDENHVVLWCVQGCLQESCEAYETIEILRNDRQKEKIAIIGNSPPPGEKERFEAAVKDRGRRLEEVVSTLKNAGYQMLPFYSQNFPRGRYLRNLNAETRLFSLGWSKRADTPLLPGCAQPTRACPGDQLSIPYPWQIPEPLSQGANLILSVLQVSPEGENSDWIDFMVEAAPTAPAAAPLRLNDKVRATWEKKAVPEQVLMTGYDYSPGHKSLLLRLALNGTEGIQTTEMLLSLERLHRQHTQPPLVATRGFGSKLAEYWAMSGVWGSSNLLTFGMAPAFHDYNFLKVIENSAFIFRSAVLDIGFASEGMFFASDKGGKFWSLLGLGPALRIGRFMFETRIRLLSFRGGTWHPGISHRVLLPLVINREWEGWSFLIPALGAGYDCWYNNHFSYQNGFGWIGFSFAGNVFDKN